jgi:hypothetical protein
MGVQVACRFCSRHGMENSTSSFARNTLFGFENRQVDVRETVFRIVGGSALLGTKRHFMENHDPTLLIAHRYSRKKIQATAGQGFASTMGGKRAAASVPHLSSGGLRKVEGHGRLPELLAVMALGAHRPRVVAPPVISLLVPAVAARHLGPIGCLLQPLCTAFDLQTESVEDCHFMQIPMNFKKNGAESCHVMHRRPDILAGLSLVHQGVVANFPLVVRVAALLPGRAAPCERAVWRHVPGACALGPAPRRCVDRWAQERHVARLRRFFKFNLGIVDVNGCIIPVILYRLGVQRAQKDIKASLKITFPSGLMYTIRRLSLHVCALLHEKGFGHFDPCSHSSVCGWCATGCLVHRQATPPQS